tara:strand:+ start:1051 stop:1809 length:759 start_codon:yes stop_codon:yes gene_type:complete
MKRLFDLLLSISSLLIVSPLLISILILVYLQDKSWPFFIASRVGKNERIFKMVKIRTMIPNADSNGVDSTSNNDIRITRIGSFIRKWKLDELTQFWNIINGDMSFVGPRPNVKRETEIYTNIEKNILKFKPGLTDFASIVFSDEGDIINEYEDPDIAYNQLIRPWKSRLAIVYIENQNILLDLRIIVITFISLFNRRKALGLVTEILKRLKVSNEIIEVSKRRTKLIPSIPPGSNKIVTTRNKGNIEGKERS